MTTSLWLSLDKEGENDLSVGGYVYSFNNPINFTDPDGNWPDMPSFGSSLVNRVKSAVRSYVANKIDNLVSNTKNYVRQQSNDVLKSMTPSLKNPFTKAKPEKAQKGSGYGVNFTVEGGKDGGMKTPQGDRNVKSADMTIFMTFAMDVFGPETFMPGAAPDGSNPFKKANIDIDLSPASTSMIGGNVIHMDLENYSATETVGWNTSQVHKQTKDTAVAASQKPVIQDLNGRSKARATQEMNKNNRELQKKINYYIE